MPSSYSSAKESAMENRTDTDYSDYCGHPKSKFTGAADAPEPTATRETRELKEEFFRIPGCPY
jgi:hypothetical protein